MQSKTTPAARMALGGVLAALAVVIMGLGTIIPVATYVCPMLCMLILQLVLKACGGKVAWAWYGAVALLSVLMAPDKEAAAVFAFLGYYPIVKPALDKKKPAWLWKGLLFNVTVLILYWLLMHLFGMDALKAEFSQMGTVMLAVLLVLGNVTFFLTDRILGGRVRRRRR